MSIFKRLQKAMKAFIKTALWGDDGKEEKELDKIKAKRESIMKDFNAAMKELEENSQNEIARINKEKEKAIEEMAKEVEKSQDKLDKQEEKVKEAQNKREELKAQKAQRNDEILKEYELEKEEDITFINLHKKEINHMFIDGVNRSNSDKLDKMFKVNEKNLSVQIISRDKYLKNRHKAARAMDSGKFIAFYNNNKELFDREGKDLDYAYRIYTELNNQFRNRINIYNLQKSGELPKSVDGKEDGFAKEYVSIMTELEKGHTVAANQKIANWVKEKGTGDFIPHFGCANVKDKSLNLAAGTYLGTLMAESGSILAAGIAHEIGAGIGVAIAGMSLSAAGLIPGIIGGINLNKGLNVKSDDFRETKVINNNVIKSKEIGGAHLGANNPYFRIKAKNYVEELIEAAEHKASISKGLNYSQRDYETNLAKYEKTINNSDKLKGQAKEHIIEQTVNDLAKENGGRITYAMIKEAQSMVNEEHLSEYTKEQAKECAIRASEFIDKSYEVDRPTKTVLTNKDGKTLVMKADYTKVNEGAMSVKVYGKDGRLEKSISADVNNEKELNKLTKNLQRIINKDNFDITVGTKSPKYSLDEKEFAFKTQESIVADTFNWNAFFANKLDLTPDVETREGCVCIDGNTGYIYAHSDGEKYNIEMYDHSNNIIGEYTFDKKNPLTEKDIEEINNTIKMCKLDPTKATQLYTDRILDGKEEITADEYRRFSQDMIKSNREDKDFYIAINNQPIHMVYENGDTPMYVPYKMENVNGELEEYKMHELVNGMYQHIQDSNSCSFLDKEDAELLGKSPNLDITNMSGRDKQEANIDINKENQNKNKDTITPGDDGAI